MTILCIRPPTYLVVILSFISVIVGSFPASLQVILTIDCCPVNSCNVIWPGFLASPQSIEIDYRPDKKFRPGFIVAPDAAGAARTDNKFPFLDHLPKQGKVVSFRVSVEGCPRIGAEVT